MILSMGVSHYRISMGRPPTSIPILALAFSMVAVGAAGLVTAVAIPPIVLISAAVAIPQAVAMRVAAAGTADADRGPGHPPLDTSLRSAWIICRAVHRASPWRPSSD
jgi:hypothetical protein